MGLVGRLRRPEIDQYAIKFIIGIIALSLPWIEWFMTGGGISSISESYWTESGYGPWPRNIFVGFLFAISALLMAYNGTEELEMWLGKVAALCSVLIPMFPCGCDKHEEIIPNLHILSAGVMFAILAAFCIIFYKHAKAKRASGDSAAIRRMFIYGLCCIGTAAGIVMFIAYAVTRREILIYYGEALGLVSFGVSWLTASRMLPLLTLPDRREKLFG